jgi:hypothetical protein
VSAEEERLVNRLSRGSMDNPFYEQDRDDLAKSLRANGRHPQ